MNIEMLTEESIISIFSYLHWRDLKSVSDVSSLFEILVRDSSLHTNKEIQVDATDEENQKFKESLRYVCKIRDITKVKITDIKNITKDNPAEKSILVTRLLGHLSSAADDIEDLEIDATISESCLGVIQIFQNLKKLKIQDFFAKYDEFYEKNRRPCLGYYDYCRLRDTWSLERLICVKLLGKSWTIMGSLLHKTNKGKFRSMCCYHMDKRDVRLWNQVTGGKRADCGFCEKCPRDIK